MKTRDITPLHSTFLRMAKHHKALYAEDAVQDFWVQLLEIELNEGSLDRLAYGNTINLYYCYKAIGGIVIRSNAVEARYMPIEAKHFNVAEEGDEVPTAEIDTNTISQLFLDYVFQIKDVQELATEYSVTTTTIYNRISNERKLLKDIYPTL